MIAGLTTCEEPWIRHFYNVPVYHNTNCEAELDFHLS